MTLGAEKAYSKVTVFNGLGQEVEEEVCLDRGMTLVMTQGTLLSKDAHSLANRIMEFHGYRRTSETNTIYHSPKCIVIKGEQADGDTIAAKFIFESDFLRREEEIAKYVSKEPLFVQVLTTKISFKLWMMVMELGTENLEQHFIRENILGIRRVVPILKQLTAAVTFLHESHIAHRDLKPVNIMLFGKGTWKICDFGHALWIDCPEGLISGVCGTDNYRLPEMSLQRQYKASHVDIWGIGVIGYKMLTGTYPFPNIHAGEIIKLQGQKKLQLDKQPIFVMPDLRNFFRSVLCASADKRLTIQQMAKHSFLNKWADNTFRPFTQPRVTVQKLPSPPFSQDGRGCYRRVETPSCFKHY